MSEHTTPIEPFFELQRETIAQTVSLLSGPRQVRRSLTREGAAASRHAQEQALALFRQAVHQTVGATDAVVPPDVAGETLHDRVDELFDGLADHQEATLESLDELREQADDQAGARAVAQLALLMRVNESVERQVVTTAEQCEQRLLEGDDVTGDLEAAIEEVSEALDASLDRLETLESDVVEIPITEDRPDTAQQEDDESETAADMEPETAGDPSVDESETADSSVPVDEVRCRVCDESFGAITYSHLQTHDMTIEEYTEEYGEDVPLRPDDRE